MADESRLAYEKAVDLFAQGEAEEACQALLRLIAENPQFSDAYESLGMMYYKRGLLDKAIEWTTKLAKICPDNAMAHTNLSIFYMKSGMKEKAEEEKALATVIKFQNLGKTGK